MARPPAPTLIQCRHGQALHEVTERDKACACCGQPRHDGQPYTGKHVCFSCGWAKAD